MEDKTLLWIIAVGLVCSIVLGLMAYNKTVVAEAPELPELVIPPLTLSETDKADIADIVVSKMPAPVSEIIYETNENGEQIPMPIVNDGADRRNQREYEDDMTEAKAEEMATAEIDTRDFKKAVYGALTSEEWGVDLDSYKDITELKVMDVDVDDNEVTLDLKVYYFLDGDEDETEKARLEEFVVVIDDLDFDDDFEDAEVDEDYLDSLVVKKIYN